MRLSVGLANAREGRQNPYGSITAPDQIAFARAADSMGFHALWANEAVTTHPKLKRESADPPLMLEPMMTLAVVAGATERIRLMVSTVALPLHEPINLAHEVASLDVLSGGRLVLGVGLGGREQFLQLRGHLRGVHRGTMMTEQLELMRRLWTEHEVTFEGEYFRTEAVELHPKPLQDPMPVLEAGKAATVLERVARHTQGWIDSAHDPDTIAPKIDRLRELTIEQGRSWSEMSVARQFYVSVGRTHDEAVANANAADPSVGSSFGFSGDGMESQLIGTPDHILERLDAYRAVGVDEACLIFYFADAEAGLRQLELCASQILPRLTP